MIHLTRVPVNRESLLSGEAVARDYGTLYGKSKRRTRISQA